MGRTADIKVLSGQPTTLQMNAIADKASPSTLVLRIDGVELPAYRDADVQVFVNNPDVSAPVEGPAPGYVGSIVIVPSSSPDLGRASDNHT